MSRRLKVLAALNVLGWLVAVPLLLLALVDPFVDFGDWPDRLIGDRTGDIRLRTPAAAGKPATASERSAVEIESARSAEEGPLQAAREAIAQFNRPPASGGSPAPVGGGGGGGGGGGSFDGSGDGSPVTRTPIGNSSPGTGGVNIPAPLVPVPALPVSDVPASTPPVAVPDVPVPVPARPGRRVTPPPPERPISSRPPGEPDGPGPGPTPTPTPSPEPTATP